MLNSAAERQACIHATAVATSQACNSCGRARHATAVAESKACNGCTGEPGMQQLCCPACSLHVQWHCNHNDQTCMLVGADS